jgi:hypothetical protein
VKVNFLCSTCTFQQIDVPTSQITSVGHEISKGTQFQEIQNECSLYMAWFQKFFFQNKFEETSITIQ